MRESWRFQTRAGMTGDELAERISGFMELSGMSLERCRGGLRLVRGAAARAPSTSASASATSGRGRVPPGRPRHPDGDADPDRQPVRGRSRPPGERRRGIRAIRRAPASSSTSERGSTSTRSPPQGEYLGGAIAPGVEISLTALAQRGARIPQIDLANPEAAIGKSTRSAIESGVVFGFAGLIDGISRRIVEELGEGTPIIATGGLASSIVPYCETISEIDDLLTLTGPQDHLGAESGITRTEAVGSSRYPLRAPSGLHFGSVGQIPLTRAFGACTCFFRT